MLRIALAVCAVLSLAGFANAQGRAVCKDGSCSLPSATYQQYQYPTYRTVYQSAPIVIQAAPAQYVQAPTTATAAWSGCVADCPCAAQSKVVSQATQASYAAFAFASDAGGSCGQNQTYGVFGLRHRKHPVLSRIPLLRRLVNDE